MAAAIIEIAHAWDCQVIAEGIEDEETSVLLQDLGCDFAQGYWWHRPAPLSVIMDWIKNRSGGGGGGAVASSSLLIDPVGTAP